MTPRLTRAFTLIELIVVMAIVALLLTIAVPRYMHSVDRSKEVVLRQNLAALRDALDQYRSDVGRYPASLEALVERRYLRALPEDPITGSRGSWVVVPPPVDSGGSGVFDVRSGASGAGADGVPYSEW